MASTQEEKEQICEYTGWPAAAVQENTIFYNERLNHYYLYNVTTTVEVRARTYLTRILAIKNQTCLLYTSPSPRD